MCYIVLIVGQIYWFQLQNCWEFGVCCGHPGEECEKLSDPRHQ